MAKLTTKARKELPAKDFAEPKSRKFPIENAAHARDAKARASEEVDKGKLSKSTEEKIDRAADQKLGRYR